MGKSSKNSVSKSSVNYGTTKTTNPYVTSKTTNKGTTSDFVKGSSYDTINKFVNENIGRVLNDYLNPSVNSDTNKALLNNYIQSINSNTRANLENNIINPLSDRKMIRSSQAENMYNNLANNMNSNISSYVTELLDKSQKNSADVLNNLLNAYKQGFSAISSNQAQSLNTSKGNATKVNTSSSGSSSGFDTEAIADIAKIVMAVIASA